MNQYTDCRLGCQRGQLSVPGRWRHLFIHQMLVIVLWKIGDVSCVIESAVVASATWRLSLRPQCCADIGASLISLPSMQFLAVHLHPHEFVRLRGSASRSRCTESFQSTLWPWLLFLWSPHKKLGPFFCRLNQLCFINMQNINIYLFFKSKLMHHFVEFLEPSCSLPCLR